MPIKRYNGTDWEVVAGAGVQGPQGATGASATTVVTTKGDLLTYNTTAARLAVGNNGETLVADTSQTTGLRWQGSIAGGRNALINGGFDFSQRGTGALSGDQAYTLDRWFSGTFGTSANGLTVQLKTDAAQTGFTNYARVAAGSTSGTNINFSQSLETSEVRKFQGKPIVVSFKYKVPVNFSAVWTAYVYYSTNTDQRIESFAGSGVTQLVSKQLTNTTSWTSDSMTATLPSNATSMSVMFSTGNNMVATAQFDVAQVQLELGSVPTTFSRAGGTIQGELAACQRYFYAANGSNRYSIAQGMAISASQSQLVVTFPVPMRTSATFAFVGSASNLILINSSGGSAGSPTTIGLGFGAENLARIDTGGGSGLTAGNFTSLQYSSGSPSFQFSAEL